MRVIATKPVSRMGNKKTNVGTPTMAKMFEACVLRAIANTASEKPKNMLPLSPINILAGGKLNTRKPRIQPARDKDRISKSGYPAFQKNIERNPEVINATPPARPSILSSKLIAFVIPTNQKKVRMILAIGHRKKSIVLLP